MAGTYALEGSDGTFVLELQTQGDDVTGVMTGDGTELRMKGRLKGDTIEGRVSDESGMVLAFLAEISGDRLLVRLVEEGSQDEGASPLAFVRQSSSHHGSSSGSNSSSGSAPGSESSGSATPARTGSAAGEAEATRDAGSTTGDANAAPGSGKAANKKPSSVQLGDETRIEDWNISYHLPKGWRSIRKFGHLDLLGSNDDPGGIFVGPGLYDSRESALTDLNVMLQAMDLSATPVQQPSSVNVSGKDAVSAVYELRDPAGQVTKARFWTIFSGNDVGLLVLATTTPENFDGLRARADALVESASFADPNVNDSAMAELQGRWSFSNTSFSPDLANSGATGSGYEETITFHSGGRFEAYSSSYVNAQSGEVFGGSTAASSAKEDTDAGVYTVIGDQVVLRGKNGNQVVGFQLSGDQLTLGERSFVRG